MSITTRFPSHVKTFEELFQPSATGYYIPNYQRMYSWNKLNVEQLLSDVITGTDRLVNSGNPDEEYRFLGTIITVTLPKTKAMQEMHPVDHDAVPTAVSFIIDGQQRLSTLSIFAMVLYDYLSVITTKIHKELKQTDQGLLDEINELRNKYQEDLTKIFALDLSYGNPKLKPIIIRADDDKWTKNGSTGYTSDLATTITLFCNHIDAQSEIYKSFSPNKNHTVGKNFNSIYSILKNAVELEHTLDDISDSEDDEELHLPLARDILSKLSFDVLMTSRPQISFHVSNNVVSIKQFVQLLSISYFLLKRCLVNHVEPQSETWAFDMFQSLNSTGEPLTSFDIFKAVMLQRLPKDSSRDIIKNDIKELYDDLDEYLINLRKEEKLRKIVELITILGLSYAGEQVSKLTSEQKQWLTDIYENVCNLDNSMHYQIAIKRIRHTITYTKSVKLLQESKTGYIRYLDGNMSNKLRDEAMFSLVFLHDAGHSIVNGVLNNAYFQIIEDQSPDSMKNFCQVSRAVAAFYALWWPVHRTNKLPKIHRDIMHSHGWKSMSRVNAMQIIRELQQHVHTLPDRDAWITSAADRLRYGSGSDKLVRLALFVSMLNTTTHNGRLVASKGENISSYLSASRWYSDSFATIEHIAPQTQTDDWDEEIYPEYVSRIGNLVLLPTAINSGTGNKSWPHKWIYYSYTAETDIAKQQTLKDIAYEYRITLDDDVVNKLQTSTYNQHLQPILGLGISYKWDKTTIDKRSLDICSLLYDRMMQWLKVEE